MTSSSMIIAARLKMLRKEKKVSQRDMASLLGITQSGYAGYEAGTRAVSVEKLLRLAAIYDVSMDYVTGRTNRRSGASR